ncbi:MAG: indolepyruvate oxidoreductase subunit beta [Oscillospiraceae bacterium]|nr:indolepyruvate oxidoreductase subunit beta [Oscillospiraceae bacterium]
MNIVIAGVGGQGSILAAKILGSLYMERGLDVKVNEVHGMSQRGGTVVTMVRAGEQVYSPLVAPGTADLLIGLELTEAVRAVSYLKPDGKSFVSSRTISIAGQGVFADPGLFQTINALELAEKAGNKRCENTVLLGAASKMLDFTQDEWKKVFRFSMKPELFEVNYHAFLEGCKVNEILESTN